MPLTSQHRPFPFTCLEVNCLARDYIARVCSYAKRFNIQAIAHMSTEWREFQMIDHSEWGVPPINDQARRFMEETQQSIREASEYVSSQGLDFYIWRRELRLPMGFVQKYGVKWIDFDNCELWDLVRWNLRTLFRLFPKMRGMFLTCTGEQKPGEWITADGIDGQLPLWQRFERMFRTVQETCDQHDRRVIFRNHGAGDEGVPLALDESTYMGSFLKAARNIGKGMTLMGKGVEPDFQPSYSFNSILSHMAATQPTCMELSLPMEYNSVSRTPFPMVEDVKYRLLKAREIGCVGAVARIDWHMSQHQTERSWTCLGNVNELSCYAFGRLVNEIGTPVDQIYHDFARERFGQDAQKIMVPILQNLYEAGCKTYYELGVKGCMTPSGAPLRPDNLIPCLTTDHPHRWSFSPIDYANHIAALSPNKRYLTRIENEKNEALDIYREALDQIKGNLSLFAEEAGEMLCGCFERVIGEATIRRDYMVAFAAWVAYDQTGDAFFEAAATGKLKALAPNLSAFCATYDLLDWEPDSELGFAFGSNSCRSMQELIARLEESRAFWKGSAQSARPPRYSRDFDKAIEIPLAAGHLTIDPHTCAILEFVSQNCENSLSRPSAMISLRLGGLVEQGKHIGRQFIRSRTLVGRDGTETTSLEFAYAATQITFRKLARLNGVAVSASCKSLPYAGILHFPWLETLAAAPIRLSSGEVGAFASALQFTSTLGEGWKCSLPDGQSVFMIDATPQAITGGLPGGLSWKVGRQADVTCFLFSDA